jgi:hypothetical protein
MIGVAVAVSDVTTSATFGSEKTTFPVVPTIVAELITV